MPNFMVLQMQYLKK